jgi:hypothetical protein
MHSSSIWHDETVTEEEEDQHLKLRFNEATGHLWKAKRARAAYSAEISKMEERIASHRESIHLLAELYSKNALGGTYLHGLETTHQILIKRVQVTKDTTLKKLFENDAAYIEVLIAAAKASMI